MIIWLNGAFGAGKTTCAFELNRRIPNSFVYDPEKIMTADKPIDRVVEEIAAKSGLNLLPDTRNRMKKELDRIFVLLKLIR